MIRERLRPLGNLLGGLISIGIFALALWFLHGEMARIHFADVLARAGALPTVDVLAACLLAGLGYTVLTGYDTLALRYLGHGLPYRRVAPTAFMAYAVGHNVGIAALSGGTIRYRVYSSLGLSALEIAQVIGFCTFTFALGASGLLGSALLLMPDSDLALLELPVGAWQLAGGVLLAVFPAYLAWAAFGAPELRLGNWSLRTPSPRIALAQLAVACGDLLCAAGTLYVLLESDLGIGFPLFLGIYLLAMVAGIVSSVPGGIGVFEAVMLTLLPGADAPTLLGTILVYRVVYYVLPLCLALGLLAVHELGRQGARLRRVGALAGDWLGRLAPDALAVAVFLAGVVLLVSGATPAVHHRLHLLEDLIPLGLLELSNLVASVVGVLLLVLARGLQRRLAGAWRLTMCALGAGALAALLKGLDYEEALVLGAVAAVLWTTRAEFRRDGRLREEPFGGHWVLNIALVLIGTVWIALLAYRHVEYSSELFWRFAFDANAPRTLRAAVLVATALCAFAVWKLLRPQPPGPAVPSADDLTSVQGVLAHARDSAANVALLGDKRLLFSPERDAFLMYQVSGRSWIALGDPVGAEASLDALAWSFRELCDRFDGRPVFYQVTEAALGRYVDMGLSLVKLGEDALVPLADFSLQGSRRAELRQAHNKGLRAGMQFELVPAASVPALMEDLRAVSDAWLAERSGAEKGFSLGSFVPEYLARFDCALVRVEGRVVAFANLWVAPGSGELSVDLMRHAPAAPKGVMDFLFVELMLWGSAQGFGAFSLGMAPLSGLENRPLAPLWHRVGRLVYRFGDEVYNFEGLRRYKEKFGPHWRPRYMACPGGADVPAALLDASTLIAGSLRGIWSRSG